ncbi:hypothetical protein LEAN103870_17125 [Legionella anisa]|uniref:Uncharacterized protein n=1 Tax=Legionella anisa TaxID=28082 RepID=A0AAX0WX12_9GAMM|nr:hypothetical protein [Legionella anisa]AWN72469.1 hypothetical protein DLD14_00605 [Legionella anisa]KTC72344.1 hypothetical protein Lani_1264 [Legionella anisa]MBN5935558.1 hypothetical protein [Legionella anisa]MCW8423233.1 hypothetical protein [Legionella anisa]MCW8446751.1 hypothetical protein [Legionella anisa]
MTKIIVIEDNHERVLLDTEDIRLHEMSTYYQNLSYYKKLDEALKLLSSLDEKEYWRAAILLKNLSKKKADAEEQEIHSLIEQCNDFSIFYIPNSKQLPSMEGLSCYRVGADAGAGFKEGDLDVLGTEGLLHCTGVLVVTEDEEGIPCYYVGHIFGERETYVTVQAELDRILADVQQLTGRELTWSDLAQQVTVVGPGSSTDEPSSCYKQAFKILTREGAKPNPLFGSSVAFNLTGKGDLIVLDPVGQLIEGIEFQIPRAGHGVYSPVDNLGDIENTTIEKQISDAIQGDDYPHTNPFIMSKL